MEPEILTEHFNSLKKGLAEFWVVLFENVPELLADIFGRNPDDPANQISFRNRQGARQIRSPFEIVASNFAKKQSRFDDAAIMATLKSSAVWVCALMSCFGWPPWPGLWVVCCFVIFRGVFDKETLIEAAFWGVSFAGPRCCSYYLSPGGFSGYVVFVLGLVFFSVFHFMFYLSVDERDLFGGEAKGTLWVCSLSICFYMPLWFGLLLVLLASWTGVVNKDLRPWMSLWCLCFAAIRGVVYVSSGGFSGFVISFVGSLILAFLCFAKEADAKEMAEALVSALPWVCVLMLCFFLPLWIGLFVISIAVCVAILYGVPKVVRWLCVSFVALWGSLAYVSCGGVSYVSCGGFSGFAICLLGSIFSYACLTPLK